MVVPVVRWYDLSLMSNVAAPDFFCRILRVSRGGKVTTGVMVLIVFDWLSNMLVEEIHDMLEERIIEVNFLLPFAEIRHVSLWKKLRNSVVFKLLSVEKTWTVSASEIRLWKLAQARCYQPVSLFKGFQHQDFSTIAVDTQEWNWGSWGCGWGRMYCKVWHCAGRASWDGKHALCSFRPQICCLLNSSSKRMGCIQFNYHLPSSSLFVGKH